MLRRVLLSTSAVMISGAVLALALYATPSSAWAQRQRPLPDASTAGMVVFFNFDTINGVAGFGGGFGGAAPSIVDGMLYVGSGYAILGGSPGNVLLAFGLDD